MEFQPALERIHICVKDRRQVQRNHLREDQSAHHGEAERTARIRAGADAESNGRGAHQSGHRGHGDRTEANQAAFIDRFRRGFVSGAFALDGKINHHDRVLLHDSDQHDDADETVEVQAEMKNLQREQRAESRRRQSGKNRNRVNEALV